MRRVFTIILGTLAGLLLLLALVGQVGLHRAVAEVAFANRVNRDICALFTTVDSAAPLPENEGKPVRVCGEAKVLSSEAEELVDELLGVRVKALYLTRAVEDSEGHPSTVPLCGRTIKRYEAYNPSMKLTCSLGGFTFKDSVPYKEISEMTHPCLLRESPVRRDEMHPVPEVLQGAEWVEKDHCWSYMDGKATVSSRHMQAVGGGDAVVYGMQQGNKIVPYPYRVHSWSLWALWRRLSGDAVPLCLNVALAYSDYADPHRYGGTPWPPGNRELSRMEVRGEYGYCGRLLPLENSESLGEMICVSGLAIALGTLLGLPLLAVTLLCLRRRKARWMLYVGGGMLLLTALNIWNAHWIW